MRNLPLVQRARIWGPLGICYNLYTFGLEALLRRACALWNPEVRHSTQGSAEPNQPVLPGKPSCMHVQLQWQPTTARRSSREKLVLSTTLKAC